MCGIAYTSFPTGPLASMQHRGPDGYARVELDHGTLHHSLLAINGYQPQPIAVGDALVVYNGELYDYEDDATVMAEGFVADGLRFLDSVNGDWAMLVVQGDTVMAVRDRFGLRPLFRYWDGQRLIYASNVAIIAEALAQIGVRLLRNPDYPIKGRVPFPSAFRHVCSLDPGTATVSGLFAASVRWYSLLPHNHGDLAELVADAVRVREHPNGAIAVSGGVDSYLMAKCADQAMPRYHLSVTGEMWAAARLGAQLLKPDRIDASTIAEVLEQPYYALPPNLFLADAIDGQAPWTRVVLTGIGADELFGGYQHHLDDCTPDAMERVYGVRAEATDWRAAELAFPIPYHYGYRTDQAFLRYGIEVRHPFLDHRVVETALCERPDGKRRLREIAASLGWAPQPKRGFSADLSRYVIGDVATALAGLPLEDPCQKQTS